VTKLLLPVLVYLFIWVLSIADVVFDWMSTTLPPSPGPHSSHLLMPFAFFFCIVGHVFVCFIFQILIISCAQATLISTQAALASCCFASPN
jgi:hypothetical protein